VYNMEKNLKIKGNRLRECRKEKGLSQEVLIELCHIQSRTTLSCAESKNELSEVNLEMICEVLGVRKEYILGIDNYKTEGALLSYYEKMDHLEFDTTKEYLKTLGFSIEPFIEIIKFPVIDIYKSLDKITPFLYTGELNRLKQKYDFNQSYTDFSVLYLSDFENIRLTKPIDYIEEFESISMNSKAPDSFEEFSSNLATLGTNTTYHLRFEIINKSTGVKRDLYIKDLQFLFTSIKNTATALLNTYIDNN